SVADRTLLLIDDDALSRRRLAHAMERRGYAVTIAEDVAAGTAASPPCSNLVRGRDRPNPPQKHQMWSSACLARPVQLEISLSAARSLLGSACWAGSTSRLPPRRMLPMHRFGSLERC